MKRYMIAVNEEIEEDSYRSRLMQYHSVPYFMPYELRVLDGRQMRYYLLPYHTILKTVMEHISFTTDKLVNILLSIVGVMETVENYLLDFDGIVWKADRISVEVNSGELVFCYNPETCPENGSLKELLSELLQAIGKRDEQTVLLLLQFYNLVTEPDCTLEQLIRFREERLKMPAGKREVPEQTDISEEVSADTEDTENTEAKEQKSLPVSIVRGLFFIFLCVNFLLIACLLLNILTYDYISYLFCGLAALILVTVIYMSLTRDESPEDIMQAYFQENGFPENNMEDIRQRENAEPVEPVLYGETTLLNTIEQSEVNNAVVEEDTPEELCLMPMREEEGEPIRMYKESVVLGCMPEGCDYILAGKGVSRMHAKLIKREGELYVLDLNSTNGTYLNGECLDNGETYVLEKGDVISFSTVEFYVAQYGYL
ncbi:MAG: FHA domain-containing protein [Clostridium sp.]|nr:FHA domain-containing protein [Clostridium sp.]